MTRAVIYARFSTELQSDRSIDDQVTLCRMYADREGYQVVGVYEDKARSGASIFGRDGLQQLLFDANHQKFDMIIVEALDRLSRDMEDMAGMYKRMSFLGVKIMAVHDGEANTVMVGLRGLVSQMFREDNAQKVRRGLSGRVKQGLSAGGKSYGYRPDPLNKGDLLINEDEAYVVRRIYREYAAGKSPRAIARDLNNDNIPPPRGKVWAASTLNGSSQRNSGILRNPLYNGQLVWNRVRMIKDPDTGRRLSRINPKDQWEWVDKPDLRIVDEDTFKAVQARKEETGRTSFFKQRRPKHLLSGLLKCGSCGSGMSTFGADKSGRKRLRCTGFTERGVCGEPRTFYLDVVEDTALDILRTELRHPEVITAYVKEYHAERKRLELDRIKGRTLIEKRLVAVEAEANKILDIVVKADTPPEFALSRLQALSDEKKKLTEELGEMPQAEKVVSLHPAALDFYDKQLAHLGRCIGKSVEDGDTEAASAMREIISKIIVSPTEDGFTLEIQGDLTKLLGTGAPATITVGKGGSGGPLQPIAIPFVLRGDFHQAA